MIRLVSFPFLSDMAYRHTSTGKHLSWVNYLKDWDKYKDKIIQSSPGPLAYSDPIEEDQVRRSPAIRYFDRPTNITGARILMGIFTMDTPLERERREAIRSTYLSYYNQSYSTTPHRICSLQDLLSGSSVPNHGVDCQMAYTFVMGSNLDRPTNLVGTNSSIPLTIPTVPSRLQDETDIIHLIIRENMEDGETPSWFRYATKIVDEEFYFDYIGKTDTDTLIFPNHLLESSFMKYPTFPNNVRVYGGQERLKYVWGSRMVGPLYMAGHLYWMSIDLARFVTTTTTTTTKTRQDLSSLDSVDYGIEDMTMGNFVHTNG